MVKGLGRDDIEQGKLTNFVVRMKASIEGGSVKHSTNKGYTLAINRYIKFMSTGAMQGLIAWPPTKFTVAIYMRYIELAKDSYASLRQFYFAINWRLRNEGEEEIKDPIIKQIIKTAALTFMKKVNRKHGLNPKQLKRYHKMCVALTAAGHKEYEVVSAIAAMQYSGIARINEVLEADRRDLTFEVHPHMGIVGCSLDYQGKCDTVREGHTKHIEKLEDTRFCATHKIHALLKAEGRLSLDTDSPEWDKPLFQWKKTRITYSFLMSRMKVVFKKMGLNCAHFASHSFRSGATTAALARGCPMWMVKRQGGWRSEAINGYFIPPIRELSRPSASMGLGRTVFRRKA
jgi:hypothetical protein